MHTKSDFLTNAKKTFFVFLAFGAFVFLCGCTKAAEPPLLPDTAATMRVIVSSKDFQFS